MPGTLVASTTPNEIKQECSALAHMLLVCPDIKALYTHLHQTDPVFYDAQLTKKLIEYAESRAKQLPTEKTISLFELSHLFAPASRAMVLQYLIDACGGAPAWESGSIVLLEQFIDLSDSTPDVPAPDPELPTQEEIRQAALEYLLNPHVVNTPEKIDEKLANDPSFQRNAETLSVIEKKYGKQALMDLATTIHDQFHHALAFIEGTDTNGMARAYRDIAKQYYFFSHPETHDAQVAA